MTAEIRQKIQEIADASFGRPRGEGFGPVTVSRRSVFTWCCWRPTVIVYYARLKACTKHEESRKVVYVCTCCLTRFREEFYP